MKEGKMITISEILEGMNEVKRNEIKKETEKCLKVVFCDDVPWEKFLVYEENNALYYMLENPEFIMAISDHIKNEMDGIEIVKIAISKGKERDLSFIRLNKATAMVTVFIPKKEWGVKNK